MKHWILPTPHNNHRANLLKPFGLALILSIYLGNQLLLKTIGFLRPDVLGYSSEITTTKVLNSTNQAREKLNLPKLTLNDKLSHSAQAKAQDMFAKGYWAHNAPDGTTPWSFFQDAGYEYKFAGENLAKDFYNTDSLMSAWMKSPTHRANIVSNNYSEIGIGVVNGQLNGYETTLVVQHFGSPRNGQVAPAQDSSQPEPLPLQTSVVTPVFNLHQLSRLAGEILFVILISVLAIDAYVTLKNNTHRLSGSSLAHIVFLFFMLSLLVASQQGMLSSYAAFIQGN